MVRKLLLLLVITASVIAAEDCECNSESDKQAVWSYLKSLSAQMDGGSDKNAYPVLPAVLSPLVGCDCRDKARPKRKIMPDVPVTKLKHRHDKKKSIHRNDRKCPTHYARVGAYCVKEELLD